MKAGKVDVSKNWMQALAFEGCAGAITWSELLAFVAPLPEGLVSLGGGKSGYGFFLLGHPTYGTLDVPRALASLAVRAASDDRAEASKPDEATRPDGIQLALDYGRGAAGIQLAPEARRRVLEALAPSVVKHGLVPEAYLPALTSLQHGDAFRVAEPFGTQQEWLSALSAALIDQVSRSETDKYTFKGIPHLECVEAAFPLLAPADLAAVLAIGAGSLDTRPWATIAREALARLTPEQRVEMRAAAAKEDDKPARQNSRELMTLLA